MSRVLVVLPTSSYRTPDFVRAAASLGVELSVASEEDPPLDLGDRFVRVDCSRPQEAAAAIVALADRSPIDAVVAADDAGVVIAALASENLGLAHHPPAAAAATRDKLEMRHLLERAEVPQAAYRSVTEPEDMTLDFPVVLKPRTGTASLGVIRVDSPSDLPAALAEVTDIARGIGEVGPVLAEAFLPGAEVAVEGMVLGGDLHVLAMFDKPDAPTGPYFAETLLVTPSTLPPELLDEIQRVVAAGVAALGLRQGPIHAEVRLDGEGRVHLLEVAARSIGGLCGRSLRFGLGNVSLEEVILATALGRPLAATQARATGVMMLPIERSGVLRTVEGVDLALAVDGITEVDITVPPGTRLEPLPRGNRYLGFVFGIGPTPADVAERIRKAASHLDIRIEPE